MREYIVNLTDYLIRKNHYDEWSLPAGIPDDRFIGNIKCDLLAGDVRGMGWGKLGQVVGSLEYGDVLATQSELFKNLHYSGDMEEFFRELVALCLAHVIRDRIFPGFCQSESIPPYRSGRRGSFEKEYRRDQDEQLRHCNPPGTNKRGAIDGQSSGGGR